MGQFTFTNGFLARKATIASAVDYALTADDKDKVCIGVTMSAASKTVTLGLAAGQFCILINDGGTNAFTVKNIAGDTGTSLAAGKVALCIGGTSTADTEKVYVLN